MVVLIILPERGICQLVKQIKREVDCLPIWNMPFLSDKIVRKLIIVMVFFDRLILFLNLTVGEPAVLYNGFCILAF